MRGVLEVFPPESYKRLRYLMDHGQGYRAPGPCTIPSCSYTSLWDQPLSPLFVWDHCHPHDYVRGILCRLHNAQIGPMDRQDHLTMRGTWPYARYGGTLAELLAYRDRCPHCAALGPWQPLMVRHPPGIVARAAYLNSYAERRVGRDERRAAHKAAADKRRASALKGWETRRAALERRQLAEALEHEQALEQLAERR